MLVPELAATKQELVDLAAVWRRLTNGRDRITHTFFTPTACGFALTRRTEPPVRTLTGRRRLVLELVLKGVSQNTVGIELDLAPSTVCAEARAGLSYLGVGCTPSRVHPLLMLAATVACTVEARVEAVEHTAEGVDSRWVVIPRPDLGLHALPRAQRETVSLLVEGRSHAEMAVHRGTSPRTIANQLAASFRALDCSGRGELLQRLFVLSGWLPESRANAA